MEGRSGRKRGKEEGEEGVLRGRDGQKLGKGRRQTKKKKGGGEAAEEKERTDLGREEG